MYLQKSLAIFTFISKRHFNCTCCFGGSFGVTLNPLLQKLCLSSLAALEAKVCHEVVNRECVINLEGIKHPP